MTQWVGLAYVAVLDRRCDDEDAVVAGRAAGQAALGAAVAHPGFAAAFPLCALLAARGRLGALWASADPAVLVVGAAHADGGARARVRAPSPARSVAATLPPPMPSASTSSRTGGARMICARASTGWQPP